MKDVFKTEINYFILRENEILYNKHSYLIPFTVITQDGSKIEAIIKRIVLAELYKEITEYS